MGELFSLHNHVKWVHIVELFSPCVKKRYESESVYPSESDYVDPPATYGIGRPSETIQNLILMHKLIRIHSVFFNTLGDKNATAKLGKQEPKWETESPVMLGLCDGKMSNFERADQLQPTCHVYI